MKPEIGSLAWRPDGKMLALGLYKEVRLTDPASGKELATLSGPCRRGARAGLFARRQTAGRGRRIARARRRSQDLGRRDAQRDSAPSRATRDCIYAVAFSPDGKSLATSSYDKLIKLWDVATGKEIRTLKDHIDAVYALAFTPDGKRLVSGAADRSVKVWDVASGERLYTMSEPLDGLNTIALDPTGTKVAAGGLDKTIRIWQLGERARRCSIR